jgi:hypothetical protein
VKKGFVLICALLLLPSCALFPRRAAEINWPEKIDYMQALCELDMAWKGMNYSGSMSLSLDYPDKLQFEIYGPVGNTIVYLKKDGDRFLLVAGDEKFSDENAFEEKFDITLRNFLDDVTLRTKLENSADSLYAVRERYRVSYNLSDQNNKICWEGAEGRICIRFFEARFNKE